MEAFIAGTVSSSITNWPGKTCFLVLFAGCDFKCPYCSSFEYIEQKEEFKLNLKDLKREIKENRDFVDAVVFTGAEPCLQRAALVYLAGYCRELKLKTGLETNGSNPDVIKILIEKGLLDFIALDLKSPWDIQFFEKVTNSKTFFRTTEELFEKIKESLNLLKEKKGVLNLELRTTIIPGLIYRKEDVLDIAKEVNEAGCRWRLQGFRPNLGGVLSQKFRNVNPPTKEFLQNLKQACKKEYPDLRVEVEL